MDAAPPPPGWYPVDSTWERYWNGAFWTEHVRPVVGPVPPPPARIAAPRSPSSVLPPVVLVSALVGLVLAWLGTAPLTGTLHLWIGLAIAVAATVTAFAIRLKIWVGVLAAVLSLGGLVGVVRTELSASDRGEGIFAKRSPDAVRTLSPGIAATGPRVSTDVFTFSAPEGWERDDAAGPGTRAFVIDLDERDGFRESVNVIEDRTLRRANDVTDAERGVRQSLEDAQVTDIEFDDPVDLDGEKALVVSSSFPGASDGRDVRPRETDGYAVRQYAVKHRDTGYIVSFALHADRPEEEQAEIAESVMTTWV